VFYYLSVGVEHWEIKKMSNEPSFNGARRRLLKLFGLGAAGTAIHSSAALTCLGLSARATCAMAQFQGR